MIVAIDGPAASGKSTVARAVAQALGARYIDTGAMYRAVTFKMLAMGGDASEPAAVAEMAREMDLDLDQPADEPYAPPRILIDGNDATDAIRTPTVNAFVSQVARIPDVRRELVSRQRALASDGDAVVEGRDIGTVVFPDAEVKVFLTADPEERLRRRNSELESQGVAGADESHARVLERDRIDSTRADSPLSAADDATVIDTTALSVDEVVSAVLALAESRRGD